MMQTHKLKFKVKDDLFNMDTLAHYFLCLKIADTQIEIAVFDTKIDRCVAYEQHEIFVEDAKTLSAGLTNFVKTHSFLSAANWKTIYFMDCGLRYSFVPEEFHHQSYTASFLRLTTNIDKQKYTMQNTQNLAQNCYCHFAIPTIVYDWSKVVYRDREIVWVHQMAAFVEGLSKSPDKLEANHLHVLVDAKEVSVVHFKHGKLNFANSFASKDDADSVYYILLAMKELGLDQQDTKIWLYGNVENHKGLAKLLPDYLSQVDRGLRPKNQNFGYHFDDIQSWQGFEVFSSYYFTK